MASSTPTNLQVGQDFGLQTKVKVHSEIRKGGVELMIPLLKMADALAVQLKHRVGTEGKDHKGRTYRYARQRTLRWIEDALKNVLRGEGRVGIWVPPNLPQPGGFIAEIKTGKHPSMPRGTKGYASREEYVQQLTGNRRKRFRVSGGMWDGLTLSGMSFTRVKLSFTGKSTSSNGKPILNAKKAQFATRTEKASILTPNRAEMKQLEHFLVSDTYRALVPAVYRAEQRLQRFKEEGKAKRMAAKLKKKATVTAGVVESLRAQGLRI